MNQLIVAHPYACLAAALALGGAIGLVLVEIMINIARGYGWQQHHAIVASVDPAGFVELINGNGTHGLVSRSTVDTDKVTAFFSIAPLLPGGAA